MKRKNFTRSEVSRYLADIDRAHEQGMTIAQACEAAGISQQSYYRHKALRTRKTATADESKTQDIQYRDLALALMKQLIQNGIMPDSVKLSKR